MSKTIDQNPKITDTILFNLTTTDVDGTLLTPYKIDKVIIYYLVRNFTTIDSQSIDIEINDELTLPSYFDYAQAVKVYGTDTDPAWFSVDTNNSVLTNTDIGLFELTWVPELVREGDYIICYTWTPIIAGDQISSFQKFTLDSNVQNNVSIPTHFTDPDKYPTLLDRYTPEYLKSPLADNDLTPEVLDKLNQAIADGFVLIEDMVNQSVDVLDANAISDSMLVYLANFFNLSLHSNDSTLWRRQIKRAVPIFKKKGTLKGLQEALEVAGIKFNSMTQYWQTTSPYTWTESFKISSEIEDTFELIKSVYDVDDFDIYIKPSGDENYTTLDTDYATIEFDDEDNVFILTWTGEDAPTPISLEEDDIIKITYKVAPIVDGALESYILSLPLADTRDETEISYPPKNWNVRLIKIDDPNFDTICPTRHPFYKDIVWGKVRTEFAYSENIYNMETYNASLRNSTNPCDMDKKFQDACSCCLSSKFDINVEIEDLSTSKIEEAGDIINEYKPFHAVLNNLNFSGSVIEFMPPQQETIEMLVKVDGNETLVFGQDLFNRVRHNGTDVSLSLAETTGAIKRNMLADLSVVDSDSAQAQNKKITLYSPAIRFDTDILGIDPNNNILEILSGLNQGEYTVSDPQKNIITLDQGSPDTISFPLNTSEFPFRLSNVLFNSSVISITQEDACLFSDENADFRFSDVQPGWQIVVSSPGPLVGTYIILGSYPNDTLILDGWANTSNADNITYQLQTDLAVNIGDESDSGSIEINRRGRVDGGTDFRTNYSILSGDYLRVGSTQYKITEFINDDECYIQNWTGGNVGMTVAAVYRRLLNNKTGYLGLSGLLLSTTTNYEVSQNISNGTNELGQLLEDSQFKENFLFLIDGKYYQIASIDGTDVELNGPMIEIGLTPTPLNFDIVQLTKQPINLNGYEFSVIDRRNKDIQTVNIDTGVSLSLQTTALNNGSRLSDAQWMSEAISVEIKYKT